MADKSADPGVTVDPSRMSNAVPFEEAVQNIIRLRQEWAARPEEIARQELIARGKEERRLERLRAQGKEEGFYGPPNPRRGRWPAK